MKTKGFMSQIFEIRKEFETMNDNFIKRDKDISKEINTKKKQFIVNKNEFEKKVGVYSKKIAIGVKILSPSEIMLKLERKISVNKLGILFNCTDALSIFFCISFF